MTAPTSQPTSTGLEPNLAGLLAYVLAPVTGVVFYLLEKENRFVRFHAVQSIVFGVASFVFWIALTILSSVLAFVPFLGWLLSAVIGMVAGLGFFILWIVLMVKAFQGEEWEIPGLGKYARQYSATATI